MSFPDFFKFNKKEAKVLVKNFDQQLVRKINKKRLPSWNQIKYLFRFFNKREKVVFWSSFSLILTTALIWLVFFILAHLALLPTVGGEYIEGLVGSPKLVNPIFENVNDVDSDITSLLYARLFKRDANRQPTPDLVESYQISDDKKTYTLKLRDDIYWSDGETIDSDDVAFTFDTIQNPEVGSPLFNSFQGIIVEKLDKKQVTLTLKEPFAPFLGNLTFGLIPEHIFGKMNPANIRLAKDNLQPIAVSGPYKFIKLVKDSATNNIQTYILEINEKYFGAKPYIKTVVFKFYEDFNQAVTDLRNQTINGLSFIPHNLKEKVTSKNINLFDLQLPQYVALFFNQNKDKVLKDDVLRTCLAESIDKKAILEQVLKNSGQTVNSPILKNELGFYPDIKKYSFNPDNANAQLDKSWSRIDPEKFLEIRKKQILKDLKDKYQITSSTASSTEETDIDKEADNILANEIDPEQTFYRKDKNDNILSLVVTTADTAEYVAAARTIAKFWKNIGIQTFVELIDNKQIVKENIRDRNYSILLFGEVLGNDPDPYAFWHSSQTQFPGLNLTMFSDKDADKLLEDARSISDVAKREEYYKKFQDILAKKLPAIFLYTPTYTYAIDKNIKGVVVGSLITPSDRFSTLNNWYIKTAKQWK